MSKDKVTVVVNPALLGLAVHTHGELAFQAGQPVELDAEQWPDVGGDVVVWNGAVAPVLVVVGATSKENA